MISAETKARIAVELVSIDNEIDAMEATIPHEDLPDAYDVLVRRRNTARAMLQPEVSA